MEPLLDPDAEDAFEDDDLESSELTPVEFMSHVGSAHPLFQPVKLDLADPSKSPVLGPTLTDEGVVGDMLCIETTLFYTKAEPVQRDYLDHLRQTHPQIANTYLLVVSGALEIWRKGAQKLNTFVDSYNEFSRAVSDFDLHWQKDPDSLAQAMVDSDRETVPAVDHYVSEFLELARFARDNLGDLVESTVGDLETDMFDLLGHTEGAAEGQLLVDEITELLIRVQDVYESASSVLTFIHDHYYDVATLPEPETGPAFEDYPFPDTAYFDPEAEEETEEGLL